MLARGIWWAGWIGALGVAGCSSGEVGPAGQESNARFAKNSSASTAEQHVAAAERRFGVELRTSAALLERHGDRMLSRASTAVAHSTERQTFVSLPATAIGSARITDQQTGLFAEVQPVDLTDAPAELGHGVVVFAGAAPAGGDVFHRVTESGMEDFVVLESAPRVPGLTYRLQIAPEAGLRVTGGLLEVVGPDGAPRIRMRRPYAVDANGRRVALSIEVQGCAFDSSPVAPWGRPIVLPGAPDCLVHVRWNDTLAYPAMIDPAWTSTGSMAEARAEHAAQLTSGGRLLVAAGSGTSPLSAELFDPSTGTWAATGAPKVTRRDPVSAPLAAGRVLIAGGMGPATSSSEIYEPAQGTWSTSGPMTAREGQRSVVLTDGRVLVAGGDASTWIFTPASGTWAQGPSMSQARSYPFLHHLSDGRVLAAGGFNVVSLKTAELFDPATLQWAPTGNMSEGRKGGVGVVLGDGRVVLAGGFTYSAELFDPATGTFSPAGSILSSCNQHAALLPNGRPIVAGGCPGPLRISQLYDATTNTWLDGGDMSVAHESGTGTLLPDGSFLVAGGFLASGGVPTDRADRFSLQDNGQPCTLRGTCRSGFCVAGVCCSSACDGICTSCRAVDQQGGVDGICGPVKAGVDPRNQCTDDGTPACQNNGLCDGAGACQKYPVASNCIPQPCTDDSGCTSGHCADGICCNQECGGECVACTAIKKGSGLDGECGSIAADTDPDSECAEGPNYPKSCLEDGMCDGQGACRKFAKATVSCGATQCNGNAAVGLLCNGAGTCSQAFSYCDPYQCKGDTCLSQCENDNDCVADAHCTAQKTCVKKVAPGTACNSGSECLTHFCVDGVCCDSACTGQCEACNLAPNVGACSPVTGDPVTGHTPCVTTDKDCAGVCDGVNRAACSYPGATVTCGSPSCVKGIARSSSCDGKGACSQADDRPCGAYACGATRCNTSCQKLEDCAQGYTCAADGTCVPGSTCSEDLARTTGVGGERSCAPFLCDEATGTCRVLCALSRECAVGFVCDTSSKACVPALQPAGDGAADDGCSCRMGAGNSSPSASPWILLLLGLVGLGRRRT